MEFVDRVSAYPNRYLMTDENGHASYVVLEKADEPTTVGTPLNAETLNGMVAGLAPSGFGYGEKMIWLGFDESSWKATGTFQEDLEALFNSMPNQTCKQVQFIDESGLNAQKYFGTLWRYGYNYGVLTATNYSGLQAIRTFYGEVWQPWEWVNPPMVPGVLYRTTKRYNGKPVYAYCEDMGYMPNKSTTSKTLGIGDGILPTQYVSITPIVKGAARTYSSCTLSAKEGGGAIYRIGIEGRKTVEMITYTDLSDYTVKMFVEFTID